MSDQNLMSAIAVEQYGGPEKLLAKRVAKPVPGTNDVLVRYCSLIMTATESLTTVLSESRLVP